MDCGGVVYVCSSLLVFFLESPRGAKKDVGGDGKIEYDGY